MTPDFNRNFLERYILMSTTFFVWNNNFLSGGNNVGHASVKIADVYMSWWPYAGSKMEILKGILGSGSGFRTPTFEEDVESEGRQPDYIGDHFGWDNDRAISFWQSQLPTYDSAYNEIKSVGSAAKYQFFTYNCADSVVRVLQAAGSLDNEFLLNSWISLKRTFALTPPDITRISQYFNGNKSALLW
jgi:hypothetical protein